MTYKFLILFIDAADAVLYGGGGGSNLGENNFGDYKYLSNKFIFPPDKHLNLCTMCVSILCR